MPGSERILDMLETELRPNHQRRYYEELAAILLHSRPWTGKPLPDLVRPQELDHGDSDSDSDGGFEEDPGEEFNGHDSEDDIYDYFDDQPDFDDAS